MDVAKIAEITARMREIGVVEFSTQDDKKILLRSVKEWMESLVD